MFLKLSNHSFVIFELKTVPNLIGYVFLPHPLDIGVWQKILSTGRPNSFSKMIVWDGVAKGRTIFDAQELGLSFMGYVVENDLIHQALMSYLHEPSSDKFHLMEESNLEQLDHKQEYDRSWSRLLISSPVSSSEETHQRDFTCDLLIGADGIHSSVRRLSELESVGWNYRQSAIVCTMHHVASNEPHVTWQRFLPSGPIAMLPVC